MKNSYEILGVKPDATDAEIKSAYRALVKKYHPDNYVDNPLEELAAEKMVEINKAFDDITETRKRNSGSSNSSSSSSYGGGSSSYSSNSSSSSNLNHIRIKIQEKKFTEAEEELDKITLNSRDGEWYYLKGTIYYSRGWLDDAKNHFKTACNLSPNNVEYQSAYNRMNFQSSGGFANGMPAASCCCCPCCNPCDNPCDLCQTLICMDCCCEMMGGDFIACC